MSGASPEQASAMPESPDSPVGRLRAAIPALGPWAASRLGDILLAVESSGDELSGVEPVVVIVGGNNAGKTTIARLLGAEAAVPNPLGGATRVTQEHLGLALPCPEELSFSVRLVDTPDFDGESPERARASQQVLPSADLALFVITPLTSGNRRLIEYVRTALVEAGLPWILIWNDAEEGDAEARDQFLARVGAQPLSTHRIPWVESLATLLGPSGEGLRRGLSVAIQQALGPDEARRHQRAVRLDVRLDALRRGLQRELAQLESVKADLLRPTGELAQSVSRDSLPRESMLEAVRLTLDARVGPLRRRVRETFTKARRGLESWRGAETRGGSALGGDTSREQLARLRAGLPTLLESLRGSLLRASALDLAPVDRQVLERLAEPSELGAAQRRLLQSWEATEEERASFQSALQDLLEEELEQRGGVEWLQLALDALLLSPVAVAASVIVKTGGLGADLAVGGAGVAASTWMDRFASRVGRGVAQRARARWEMAERTRLEERLRNVLLEDALATLTKACQVRADLLESLEEVRA